MEQLALALYEFWNGFGIPAYPSNTDLNTINDGNPAQLPYLTYNLQQDVALSQRTDFIRIYYGGRNSQAMLKMGDKIKKAIGRGVTIKVGNNGYLVIHPISFQMLEDTEQSISLYGNFSIDYNLE